MLIDEPLIRRLREEAEKNGPAAWLHREAAAALESASAEVGRLRAELAEWMRSAEMACEQEPCGECAGCLTAKEHYEGVTP